MNGIINIKRVVMNMMKTIKPEINWWHVLISILTAFVTALSTSCVIDVEPLTHPPGGVPYAVSV